ncbi:outer membrane beta-barrel family protein [Sphingobacterium sp. E70]|nr:outer membrane beta-barrel family protein [Sphingobacterium sp. E70]ULT23809.1 outer membrane beta-barrel family protein [Sphingobacterium sp. E70]
MAGILNIILKKNKKTGYNGMVTLGADRFGGTNFMGSLNLRQNKFNISLTGMNMRMRTNTEGDSYRESTIDGVKSTVNQDIEGKTKGMISFGRLGLDYDLSPRTTVSVAGIFVEGKFRPYENTMITTETQGNSNRISASERSFKPRGLQAGLVQKFKTEGEELTADFNYFGGTNKSNGTYTTNYLDNSGIIGSQIQKNVGSGDNKFMTVQADYVKPFKNGMKLETEFAHRSTNSKT